MAALTEHVARAPRRHRFCAHGGRVGEARTLQADREHDQERNEAAIHGVSLYRLDLERAFPIQLPLQRRET